MKDWIEMVLAKTGTCRRSRMPHMKSLSEAKLNDWDIPANFGVVLHKWNKDDDTSYHILIPS
jgi:hypothetical protein